MAKRTKAEWTARERAGRRTVAEDSFPEKTSEPRDRTPIEVMQERVTSLEQSLKALAHTVLHDFIHWRCENCGQANRLLRYLASIASWGCDGCGCVPKEDYRQFLLYRK